VVAPAESIVAEIGARRHGIVRTDLALELGVRHHHLDRLRRAGRLVSVGRGVDRLRDRPFDWESRCQATLDLAGDGAALGLRSAGRLHRWWADRDTEAVEVLVPRGRDHRIPIGRLVQTTRLPAQHVTEVAGLRVTTPARTFFDRAGDPWPGVRVSHPAHEQAMVRVYNDALRRGGVTFLKELAVLTALAGRGRRGTQLVRNVLRRFGPEYTPTASELETTFYELVCTTDLPKPEKQVALTGEDGFIGVVDFFWREPAVVVEVDSSWHDGPLDQERDLDRDERLKAAGYKVLRFRYGQIVLRPTVVLRKLGAAIRPLAG
jgi:very-short-patch-repair endonuclease